MDEESSSNKIYYSKQKLLCDWGNCVSQSGASGQCSSQDKPNILPLGNCHDVILAPLFPPI